MALMQGMRHDDGVPTGDSTYVQDVIPNPAFTPFLKEAGQGSDDRGRAAEFHQSPAARP